VATPRGEVRLRLLALFECQKCVDADTYHVVCAYFYCAGLFGE